MKDLNAEPLIYADIGFIREAIADFFTQSNSSAGAASGLRQIIDFVVTELEVHALMARVAGKGFIFDGKLSVADAVQRAYDLRDLLRL